MWFPHKFLLTNIGSGRKPQLLQLAKLRKLRLTLGCVRDTKKHELTC